MKNLKTAKLTRLALLIAITVILAATPLGYIPAGPLSFTIMVLPVAVGGVLMGPSAGLILGLAFGITSLMKAPSEAFGQLVINYSGLFTVVICVLPRVIVGGFAGFMHKFASLKDKKSPLLFALCGGGCSAINTILFVGLAYLFCGKLVEGAFGVAIWSSLLIGGVVEMVANAFLTMAVCQPLKKFFQ
ncbi:MAG: ECF transporter S component [Oscillospiraceae bacterium]